MSRPISFLFLMLLSAVCFANEKVEIGYILHGPPFHDVKNNKLSGGLEYDVGKLIAEAAKFDPHFVELPNSRQPFQGDKITSSKERKTLYMLYF